MRIPHSALNLGRAACRTEGLKRDYFLSEIQDKLQEANPQTLVWRQDVEEGTLLHVVQPQIEEKNGD